MDKNAIVKSEAVSAFDAHMPLRFPREMVIVLLAIAVLWEIVSWRVSPFMVPGWERIFRSLVSLRIDFVLITLARVVAALLVSFFLGVALSLMMYLWSPFENYFKPVVRLFMAVPVVC